jgi:sugar phosphate isomerase/epimerase
VATYSLADVVFVLDKQNNAVLEPVEALEQVAAAGFREVELSTLTSDWMTPGERRDPAPLKAALERLDIVPRTIHTPLRGVNLCSSVDELRRKSVALIGESMRYLAELGGRTAIIHPVGREEDVDPPYAAKDHGRLTELAYQSIEELIPVAEETGVQMAFENLIEFGGGRLLITMEELRALIAGFPPELVGLCLDTGHATISGLDAAHQARVAGERLCALHLQDVDGKDDCHWVPGQGVVDWSAVGAALSDINFDGAWTIEVLSYRSELTTEQIAAEASKLREKWEKNGMGKP